MEYFPLESRSFVTPIANGTLAHHRVSRFAFAPQTFELVSMLSVGTC